jgi:hypothetical protein
VSHCDPTVYDDNETVRRALDKYFAKAGFDASTYDDKWVRIPAGPIHLVYPNFAARRELVRLHDLHHIATGFDTSFLGEWSISAWEVASGLRIHPLVALIIVSGFLSGLLIAPRKTLRAYRRGKACTNLFASVYDDTLLELTVGELRARINMPAS